MTNLLLLPVAGILLLYTLWVIFLAVMNLKRARDSDKLTRTAKWLGYPVLFLGLLIDFAANLLILTPLLLEIPREGTVTSRLKRHNTTSSGWRKAVAAWAEQLLDPFDPSGDHI